MECTYKWEEKEGEHINKSIIQYSGRWGILEVEDGYDVSSGEHMNGSGKVLFFFWVLRNQAKNKGEGNSVSNRGK